MGRRIRLSCLLVLATVAACAAPASAQTPPRKFWLAGRYDGNRIVVFFDTVKFNGTAPATARTLPIPATPGFLWQKELAPSYVAQLPKQPNSESFHIGDQYDVFLGDGRLVPVTLTTLVGYVSSDEDDDPSYIGALGQVDDPTGLAGPRLYYALQRHDPSNPAFKQKLRPTAVSAVLAARNGTFAYLSDEPVRFDLETKILSLLRERLRAAVTGQERALVDTVTPTLAVQAFRLATGQTRYYAQTEWRTDEDAGRPPTFVLSAWIAPDPQLRVLATQEATSDEGFNYELPNLLNVVDLGGGNTGIIVNIPGHEEDTLGLWEYKDGADLAHMHLFQSIQTDN
jgi:hypothetical protein